MVGNGGRKGRITPVDAEYVRRQAEAQEELDQDRKMQRFLSRERSSAYWFAATKWGILGLIAGIILGGGFMYLATVATIDVAGDAVGKGQIIEKLRRESEALPQTPPPAQQPAP